MRATECCRVSAGARHDNVENALDMTAYNYTCRELSACIGVPGWRRHASAVVPACRRPNSSEEFFFRQEATLPTYPPSMGPNAQAEHISNQHEPGSIPDHWATVKLRDTRNFSEARITLRAFLLDTRQGNTMNTRKMHSTKSYRGTRERRAYGITMPKQVQLFDTRDRCSKR